jgi:hypothetical protein
MIEKFPFTLYVEVNDDEDNPIVRLVAECGGEKEYIAQASVTGYLAKQDMRRVALLWLQDLMKGSRP